MWSIVSGSLFSVFFKLPCSCKTFPMAFPVIHFRDISKTSSWGAPQFFSPPRWFWGIKDQIGIGSRRYRVLDIKPGELLSLLENLFEGVRLMLCNPYLETKMTRSGGFPYNISEVCLYWLYYSQQSRILFDWSVSPVISPVNLLKAIPSAGRW